MVFPVSLILVSRTDIPRIDHHLAAFFQASLTFVSRSGREVAIGTSMSYSQTLNFPEKKNSPGQTLQLILPHRQRPRKTNVFLTLRSGAR